LKEKGRRGNKARAAEEMDKQPTTTDLDRRGAPTSYKTNQLINVALGDIRVSLGLGKLQALHDLRIFALPRTLIAVLLYNNITYAYKALCNYQQKAKHISAYR